MKQDTRSAKDSPTVRRKKPAKRKDGIVRKRVSSLRESPENQIIYSPDDEREIEKLAESIKKSGLHQHLVVTSDNYVVSGHRRLAALRRIGQVLAPCRVLDMRRDSMTTNEYVAMLRDHNRQRHKSVAEQVREELIDTNPDEAFRSLLRRRNESVEAPENNHVPMLRIEGRKTRHRISGQKAEHVKYIKKVVFEDRRDYWPLSVRAVHYPLLNYSFLRNIPRKLRYLNDDESYQATSNLITRMRLNGELPWRAFDDPTRPLKDYRPFSDVRQFVRQEMERLFAGYWRDLLQTQPNHVEVVCEKNTIYHMVLKVTKRFLIPTSSGRGFNSIDPWHDLYQRYVASGKERLIVIVLSDFDPEGEMIPQVGGRTLRDDFGIRNLEIVKAGVTREQIEKHQLPPQNFAKESSSNFDWFLKRNGGDNTVYELEALEPADMLADLKSVVTSVLDMDLFNAEVEREKEESVYLEATRKATAELLKGIGQ